jgi:AraC-like DNA-binding protein
MTPTLSGYEYQKFAPGAPLAPFVQFFYYFRGWDLKPERILPLSYAEMTINLSLSGPKTYLVPPGADAYFVVPQSLDQVIGICFHPWGIHSLFGIPPDQFGKHKITLEEVFPSWTSSIHQRVESCHESNPHWEPGPIIDMLRHLLATKVSTAQPSLITDAISFIHTHNGQAALPDLYKRYGCSERKLQLMFESSVGMSPKKYNRLKRFHYAVSQLPKAPELTSLALDLGYYDQAHFIHEFKAFAGISPKKFLKESNQLNGINAESWFE